MYTTFLASTFRSIRFGTSSAHGRGIAIQLNSLLDAGAVVVNDDGTFRIEPVERRQPELIVDPDYAANAKSGDLVEVEQVCLRNQLR